MLCLALSALSSCTSLTPSSTPALHVGTYNLRVPCDRSPNDWDSRTPRVLKTLDDLGLHIFGVQETIPLQIKTITDKTRYQVIGHGRDAQKSGESSSIFYDPQRLELLSQTTFWLSETPEVSSRSWGSTLPRIATIGVFKDRLSGRTLVFANTHLHHERKYMTQQKQLKVVLERLKPYLQQDTPVILTGDFNSTPERPAPVLAATYLHNARTISLTPPQGPATYTYHGYAPKDKIDLSNPDIELIDYIFVSHGIKVHSFATVDDFNSEGLASSDHFPLKAVISLP